MPPGRGSSGRRVLPAWLTLYFTLALALFMDRGAARVMRKLAGVLAWAERGVMVAVPSEEALSNARARLGAEPLRLLFWRVAGLAAQAGAPGAWWRGLRLVSLDGTTLDAQDEQANWERLRRAVDEDRGRQAAARRVPAGAAAGAGGVRDAGAGRRGARDLRHG